MVAPSSDRQIRYDEPPPQAVDLARRDVVLVCDVDGLVRWANERAERTLGARPPRPFAELVAPYAAAKVASFLAEARCRPTDMWEVIVALHGEPTVLGLYGAPYADGAVVVASELPQSYVAMHEQLTVTLNEVAVLHREAERHRRELAAAYADLQRANEALAERARLEGVVLASRELAHLLHNDLTTPVGLTDMLRDEPDLPPLVARSLDAIATGLEAAVRHVQQFRRVLRVAIRETPVGPALDLEESTRRDARTGAEPGGLRGRV